MASGLFFIVLDNVSIRSPHGCKGRFRGLHCGLLGGLPFQSAPLTDVRGDIGVYCMGENEDVFQSAPLTDVRGDQQAKTAVTFRRLFQSAPLTDVRGDEGRMSDTPQVASFNPLPSRM